MALAHSTDESMGRETLPPNDEEELSPRGVGASKIGFDHSIRFFSSNSSCVMAPLSSRSFSPARSGRYCHQHLWSSAHSGIGRSL